MHRKHNTFGQRRENEWPEKRNKLPEINYGKQTANSTIQPFNQPSIAK